VKNGLVIGLSKSGTTIIASVIQNSIAQARLMIEPRTVAVIEKIGRLRVPWVVKLLYDHWLDRPSLLDGIVRGETGFRPDRIVAIVRDPRDRMVSALMYRAYECVLLGAGEAQVEAWIEVLRDKEAHPAKHSLFDLFGHFARIFHVADSADSFFTSFADYAAWIARYGGRMHVVRYEDFVAGDTAALSAYLGLRLAEGRDIDASLRRLGRTKGSGGWRTILLPQDVAYLRERYGAALEDHGYGDWAIGSGGLAPSQGSDYVREIAREAFATRGQPSPGS
jgi:hypothetical protein